MNYDFLISEALALDSEAQALAKHLTSDFTRIGIVVDKMTDDHQLFRLLKNPKTGQAFASQEEWINDRFRSQRSTAFEARRVYRILKGTIPDVVQEQMEPGALKVLCDLPASAQKKVEIQQQALTSSVGEFTDSMLQKYPDHLMEKRVSWTLKPTMTQAAMYDRVLEQVQRWYGENGSLVSRESALEYLLSDCEANMAPKEAVCK